MCGIAGEIRFDKEIASPALVGRMTAVMESRGPDGVGLFDQGSVAFGHRRLKIIDLTEHAAQPMVDNDLGLVIAFNGCIYNYPELRKELITRGYRFFSTGDTEVILKAYHAWGTECVQHLKGMFAFAIWERDSGRVFLARDRSGIKPLYYQQTKECLRFASTLPALLEASDIDTSIDPVALNYYMTFHGVVPPPHTILNGVKKLPQAHWMMVYPDGSTKTERYWSISYRPNVKLGLEECKEGVRRHLTEAVRRRLVADVPVGILLSGGLDSSLLVGLCSQLGQQDIKTFSIGFESVGDEKGDEYQYSDLIAKHFATDHTRMFIGQDEVISHLPDCVAGMSEPMVSHDVIGFYLLSREVSKHIKAVQSGQGADEVFAGYHWYPPMMEANDNEAIDQYARVFFDRDFDEYVRVVNDEYVSAGGNHASRFVADHFSQPGAKDAINKALRLDGEIMLVDDPVKRVDNMTMAWGLEARVPFLDHELLEFAATIPAELKVKDGGKYILKEVAREIIPHEVIDRPKGYFPVPALKYLEGKKLKFVKNILDDERAARRAVFNHDYIRMLTTDPRSHITPLRGSKLWQIAVLEYWFQQQGL